METEAEIKDFIINGHKHYVPHVSIDCAIFGYHKQQLKLLLIQHKAFDGWCLPGGYIKRSETLVEAANRNVKERTGIANLFLQQFKTFGDPDRAQLKKFDKDRWFDVTGVWIEKDNWLIDQTISIGFYAITDFSQTELLKNRLIEKCAWFDIDHLPKLEFDHDEMVKDALHTVRIQLYHYPIGYNMLPEKFTLAEIQVLYETLLGKKLDARNFPKKLIALELLTKLDEKRKIGAHRSPHLYVFNQEKYQEALKQGIVLT